MANDDDLIFRQRPTQQRTPQQPRPARPVAPAASSEKTAAANDQPVDSVWTLPLLCLGLGIIACCVIVPATDANRKMVLERDKLNRDLAAVDKQLAVNDAFLKRVSDDPELAERLAQRQMKFIREGTQVLKLQQPQPGSDQMSPFLLTAMPGAAPMAKIPPRPGILGRLSGNTKMQLYAIGVGLLLLAISLVLGSSSPHVPATVKVYS